MDDHATLEPIDANPAKSVPCINVARSSFQSTLSSATLDPIARVQKLEDYMATLLYHIKPLMQKSINEAEDRIQKKVAQQTEWKIQAAHQHHDAFELRVLARPAPTIYLTTLQVVVASLQADVDAILEMRVSEPKSAPVKLTKDKMLVALFTTTIARPPAM